MTMTVARTTALPAASSRSFVHTVTLAIVWVAFATSGVVFTEPAPVDALALGLTLLLPIVGLVRFTPALSGYLSLWLLSAACAMLAATFATDVARATIHTAVSLYLYVFSFVLAAFVAHRPERHASLVLGGSLCAALIASAAGLGGYFGVVPAADLFVKFGRATGTFKDPNVFGAFLVAPYLYALHLALRRRGVTMLAALLAAGLLALAVMLSFSRGAWINLALATAIYCCLGFLTAETAAERNRLLALIGAGAVLIAAVLVAALQTDKVADLFSERASLTQSYDVGPEGRFGGQRKALDLIAENPLGIGATEFAGNHHPEEVHNVYLSMILNAGWLGGFAYWVMVAATFAVGFLAVVRPSPARPLLLVAYAAFVSNALEGIIIDSDHWRHFYTLMALVWGIAFAPGDRARVHP